LNFRKTSLISGSELSEREYKLLKKAEEKKEQNTPEIKKIVGKKMYKNTKLILLISEYEGVLLILTFLSFLL